MNKTIAEFMKVQTATPSEKLVYTYLVLKAMSATSIDSEYTVSDSSGNYITCKGTSIAEISDNTGLGRSTVVRSLRTLQKLNMIEKEHQVTSYGGTTFTKYKIFDTKGNLIKII